MTNYPPSASPPPNLESPANSNKKLWIIGSIVLVLLILMGGCVTCGALIGLTSFRENSNTSSDLRSSESSRSSEREENSRGRSGTGLAATSWTGTLSCDDGDTVPVVIKFAETGNPIYDYQTSSGLREVELTSPGQTLRFVPPGGGVTNIVLNSLDVSSERVSHSMTLSHERSGGTLIQSRSSITVETALAGSMLDVSTTIHSSSAASQPGFVIPDESATVCRGTLSRQ